MFVFLSILGILNSAIGEHSYPELNKSAFYHDCEIFNKEHVYSGPVCGSDGKTYANSIYLDCINHQNFGHVATVHSGACAAPEEYCQRNLYYEPVCGSDNNTYSNLESLLCINHRRGSDLTVLYNGTCNEFDPCYRESIDLYGENPVCASNGFTYRNAAEVKCLQQYKKDLKIIHDGGCKIHYVYSLYGRGPEACRIAQTRYEWNPLCTTDGATHPNPFIYLCYKSTSRVISDGECGAPSQNSCSLVESYKLPASYNENRNSTYTGPGAVCGSDGRTYASLTHLQCRTAQDKYLYLKHYGPCSGPDDNPCGIVIEEVHRFPICGSDGATYVSPEALWCSAAIFQANALTIRHDGPC